MSRIRFVAFAASTMLFSVAPGHRAFGQSPAHGDTTGRASAVAFAEGIAVRALRFTQGDASSLLATKPEFTESGWIAFVKHFDGFVDANGAPQFSSSFVPAGSAAIVGEKDGLVHVRIPGKLVQTNGASTTTYRIAADIDVGGTPRKVQRLTWNTCVGEAARTYCM